MDFGYKPTRKLSTSELPGVYVDPPLIIEVVNSPPFALTKFFLDWSIGGETDNDLLAVIAQNLIVAFTNHDGDRYPVEGPDTIEAFVAATSWDMLRVIIKGWSALVGQERLVNKKKLTKLGPPSNSTKANAPQTKPL